MSYSVSMATTAVSNVPLKEAADFAVSAFNSFLVSADGYRSGRVNTIIAFMTGLFAATGFWANSANRKAFFAPFIGFVISASVAIMTFQLYWYQYAYTSWELANEYRKEAEEIVSGRDRTPFSDTTCGDKKISWHKRKERKIHQKWIGMEPTKRKSNGDLEYDECLEVGHPLLSHEQVNVWTVFILLSAGGVIAFAVQVRGRDETGLKAPPSDGKV